MSEVNRESYSTDQVKSGSRKMKTLYGTLAQVGSDWIIKSALVGVDFVTDYFCMWILSYRPTTRQQCQLFCFKVLTNKAKVAFIFKPQQVLFLASVWQVFFFYGA